MLRDRLARDINDPSIQKKLLAEEGLKREENPQNRIFDKSEGGTFSQGARQDNSYAAPCHRKNGLAGIWSGGPIFHCDPGKLVRLWKNGLGEKNE